GQGAPDGIRGALKRTAKQVRVPWYIYHQCLVKLQTTANTSIKLLWMEADEVEFFAEKLPANLPTFVGTMSLHQVITTVCATAHFRDFSCFCSLPGKLLCHCFDMKEFVFPKESIIQTDDAKKKGETDKEGIPEEGSATVALPGWSCSTSTRLLPFQDGPVPQVHNWCPSRMVLLHKYTTVALPGWSCFTSTQLVPFQDGPAPQVHNCCPSRMVLLHKYTTVALPGWSCSTSTRLLPFQDGLAPQVHDCCPSWMVLLHKYTTVALPGWSCSTSTQLLPFQDGPAPQVHNWCPSRMVLLHKYTTKLWRLLSALTD
ncbi:hypothetical protein LSAT2_020904, partial [Lamellibrachia satsuma]